MGKQQTVERLILEAVQDEPGCRLEEVVMNCPELTWRAVFVEITRLSRTGKLLVTSVDHGRYRLDLPKQRKRTAGTIEAAPLDATAR